MESTSVITDSVEIRPRSTCISSMSLSLLLLVLVYMYTSKSHSRTAPSFHCLGYGKAAEGLHGNFSHYVINN